MTWAAIAVPATGGETDRRTIDGQGPTRVTSSVSDSPGTDGDGPRHAIRRGKRRGRGRRPWRSGRLEFAPRPLPFEERSAVGPTLFREQRKRIEAGTILAGLVALGTVAFVAVLAYRATRVDVEQTGLTEGAVLNRQEVEALEVRLGFDSPDDAQGATLSFDGEEVEDPTVEGDTIVWRPPGELAEGDHTLALSVPRPVLDDGHRTWRFTVDLTAPALDAPPVAEAVPIDASATVEGKAEPGATVRADGDEVEVADDGSFTLSYPRAPAGPIVLEATDEAGNRTRASVIIPVRYPGLRAVHVTGPAWSNDQLRGGVLRLVDEGRIDAVELDLKDDQGVVPFDTDVERARRIGAVTEFYDLDDAVRTLHERGVQVVGRIVTFRDPTLARAAWGAGRADQVIQAAAGGPYQPSAESGPFANFAHPAVRRYNLDLAVDAVNRGVDDILWADTRLPRGDPNGMVVPRLSGSVSDAIVGFLAEAHTELRRRGAYQGVSTDGGAVDNGAASGQDVARMAANADYVAPQIFPAYWTPGNEGVDNPITQPGQLVRRLLERYGRATADTAVLAPWLQDFTVGGVPYGETEVRAQIRGARAAGAKGFLLWDPSVTYSAAALDPRR